MNKYELIENYSKLHYKLKLDFDEYTKKIKDFDEFRTANEFLDYLDYYQIDEPYYFIELIFNNYDLHKWRNKWACKIDYNMMQIYLNNIINTNCNMNNYKINNDILKIINRYYMPIIKLNAYDNENITDINFLYDTLEELDAGGRMCGLGDDGIKNCWKLKKLYVIGNYKITTMKPFRELDNKDDFKRHERDTFDNKFRL
jgi:hypothetical protein